jgi:hypothetical protein
LTTSTNALLPRRRPLHDDQSLPPDGSSARSYKPLALLKNAYEEFGGYLLASAVCNRDGSDVNVNFDLTIAKRELFLRNAEDIGPNDVDRAVFIGSDKGED